MLPIPSECLVNLTISIKERHAFVRIRCRPVDLESQEKFVESRNREIFQFGPVEQDMKVILRLLDLKQFWATGQQTLQESEFPLSND